LIGLDWIEFNLIGYDLIGYDENLHTCACFCISAHLCNSCTLVQVCATFRKCTENRTNFVRNNEQMKMYGIPDINTNLYGMPNI